MSRTAHNSRPEIQARKLRYAASAEHQRRRAMYLAARGLQKDKVRRWNHTWALAGYPDSFPDFDEFWQSHPKAIEWLAQRKLNQAAQREINRKHAAWVAAGMPSSTSQ